MSSTTKKLLEDVYQKFKVESDVSSIICTLFRQHTP